MTEQKNKTIAETFHTKLRTPWVWLIVCLTLGLTALFYYSQKPQILIYSDYIKTLSEYQLLETRLMRDMEGIRIGRSSDSLSIVSQAMTLREIAVVFAKKMDELESSGDVAPSHKKVESFGREVLMKTATVRRYTENRARWMESFNGLLTMSVSGPVLQQVLPAMDSARLGYAVTLPEVEGLPDSLKQHLDSLLVVNAEQSLAWNRIKDDTAFMRSEELIQFFQQENLNEVVLKSKIPMVFYFLSIVLLLSTFFFLFRSKQ